MSQVKLDPSKSYRCHKPLNPKMSSESPSVTFSKKKIEHMKKLAQQLSKKIVKSPEKTSSDINILNTKETLLTGNEDCAERLGGTESRAGTSSVVAGDVCDSNMSVLTNSGKTVKVAKLSNKNLKGVDRKHKKKKRKKRDAALEGEIVPHLVRHDLSVNNVGEEGKNYATQDEYVLKKLFSKSGKCFYFSQLCSIEKVI